MAEDRKLTEMDKLAHLLEHWREHNTEHAVNYRSWAEKAAAAGKIETAEMLRRAAAETDRLNDLFTQALSGLK